VKLSFYKDLLNYNQSIKIQILQPMAFCLSHLLKELIQSIG